jgi:hypothetical protein
MSINSTSIIPQPLRSQIEAAALVSSDMSIPNKDDPFDDDPVIEDSTDCQ